MRSSTVYYRSDTRKPEEIFKTGFYAREPFTKTSWKTAAGMDGEDHFNVDVVTPYAVCMSTHLPSAALFPVSDSPSYIYVMVGNAAKQIIGDSKDCRLVHESSLSPATVIDMHSYQVQKAAKRVKSEMENNPELFDDHIGLIAGMLLYGYEVFAAHVPSHNIFCALELKVASYKKVKVSCDGLGSPELPYKEFSIGEVHFNKNFKGDSGIAQSIALDIEDLSATPRLKTPTPSYGLGGKTFPVPSKHTSEKWEAFPRNELLEQVAVRAASSTSFVYTYLLKLAKGEKSSLDRNKENKSIDPIVKEEKSADPSVKKEDQRVAKPIDKPAAGTAVQSLSLNI